MKDKFIRFLKDKKKSKKIDQKWLVRGNISASSGACAMMGESI